MSQIIGEILDNRYEIIELIGTGGMAMVYKGKDLVLNRPVAIKILKEEFNADAEFVRKFNYESQAAASLLHPNIVNVFDVGLSGSYHYIVMELVSGHTLKEYLDQMQGFMQEDAVINIALQICSALSQAHQNGIVHRDIKAQNILVSENGSVKVADFGIARAATTSTLVNTKEVVGSVHYASPEQARGGIVDARSDLYSLGILMFELATKELPFVGDTPVTVALKQIKDDLPDPRIFNSNISKGLASIIEKATAKTPAERYRTAEEMAEDLKKLRSDKSFVADPVDTTDQTAVLPKITDEDLMRHKARTRSVSETPAEKPKNKINVMLAVLAALIISLLVFGIIAFNQFKSVFDLQEVAVPNVVGLSSEEAITALTDIGLVADITETRADNEIAEGYVISQDYLEGEMLKEGFTVKLVISSGSIESLIPNVKQQTLAKARVMIENEGFDVGNIAYEFNDLPEGMVISQSPKSGIKMPENTIVDLVVSKGPEIKTYIVPSVIGKTVREAEATLNQIGLKLGSISYELSDEYEQGQVISQEFLGQEVKQGTEIPVVISNGPETESTEATTEDTSVSGEGEIRLTVSIDTTKFTSETETVRIDMVQDNLTTIVYQGEHSKSEGDEITIEQVVRGSGSATIYVYYGDVLQTEREITF